MTTMSSIERVETVLRGGIADRVPVDLHDFMLAARRSGMPFPGYFTDGEAMAQGHIASWREFGHDVVLVENGTAALAQACGVGVEYLADSAPVSFTPAIAGLEEVDRLAYHICGDATRIVGEMVDTGAAVLELDYKADLPAVKSAVSGRAAVLGVIDPSGASPALPRTS